MRLIDGDVLIEKFNEKVDMAECLIDERTAERFATFCALADAVEESHTVDAVPIVRCKDCKWSHTPYTDGFEKIFPRGALSCRMGRGLNQDPFGERLPNDDSLVSGDDFCSSGERKEGAEC